MFRQKPDAKLSDLFEYRSIQNPPSHTVENNIFKSNIHFFF